MYRRAVLCGGAGAAAAMLSWSVLSPSAPATVSMAPRGAAPRLLACGDNRCGQLGLGDEKLRGRLIAVDDETFGSDASIVALSAAKETSAFVTDDGRLFTFGRGDNGRLGHGDGVDVPSPRVVESLVNAGVKVSTVAMGENHGVAVASDGALYTWGYGNNAAALGRARSANDATPARVDALRDELVVGVAAGRVHTVAVTAKGEVWAWGNGRRHALGLDGTATHARPMRVALADPLDPNKTARAVQVACGGGHTLVLTAAGDVLAWGDDARGQLGIGGALEGVRYARVPRHVAALAPRSLAPDAVVAVRAGDEHSAALTRNGTLYTWGRNNNSQLGHGSASTDDVTSPHALELGAAAAGPNRRVTDASLGSAHSVVLLDDGRALAFGQGKSGALGQGGANGEVSIAPIEARPKAMRGAAGKQCEQVALVACGGGHTLVATR